MVLLIDNYDSFSYNLVQMAGSIRPDIKVIRNDAMTVEEIEKLNPSHIILSPGPGYPKDAGVCEEVVKKLAGKIPTLVYASDIRQSVKLQTFLVQLVRNLHTGAGKRDGSIFGWCNCRIGDCKDCSRAWNGLCAICKRVCEEDESGCGGSVKDRDKAIKSF